MKHLILPLAIVVAIGATGAAAYLLHLAWMLHRHNVERSLDPIGPPPAAPAPGGAPHPRVLLFGDSRISMWNPPPTLPGGSIVVRGRPGETTALSRLRLQRDLDVIEPDIVVLEIGVNDLKQVGLFPGRAAEIAAGVETNLRAMLDILSGGGRQVVLLTIFPVGERGLLHRLIWPGNIDGAVRATNARLRAWGGDRLTVLDCDPILAPQGSIDPRYAVDPLHLNEAGYTALDAAIDPILARLVGGGATP
ncbi:MAG TPA: GDSL-type esterase/lipase family protein [Dongiaceae bacterium]|nr:GDSL-type esterase/lipase family protein [Dongiaceae bacterium]